MDTPGPDGTTALHWATYRDDAEMVSRLLAAGADVNRTNRYDETPLSLACVNGNSGIVEDLLELGAYPNLHAAGEPPLLTCARSGSIETVKLLLRHGANPNVTDAWKGQTALMWAAAEDHVTVVETLVAHGADVNLASTAGETPLLFAVQLGHDDTMRRSRPTGPGARRSAGVPSWPPMRPAGRAMAACSGCGSSRHRRRRSTRFSRGAASRRLRPSSAPPTPASSSANGWAPYRQFTAAGHQTCLAHLRVELPALFGFLGDPAVDATNWRAEQARRPAVVNRKVCGGNRSARGAQTQHVLTSVVRTAQQRRLDASHVLVDLLRNPRPTVSRALATQR